MDSEWYWLAGFLFLVWYFVQDVDLNFKFWTLFGPNEDQYLKGKVAFITGAGSGLGRALALRWASKSVRLALNDFNSESLNAVKAECLKLGLKDKDILLLPGDVTESSNHSQWVSSILSHFGQLDILVNNAGKAVQGLFADVPVSMDKSLFELNVWAPLGLTKAFLPHFLNRRTGHVVQISSVMSRFPSPSASPYSASKAAVWSYFTSLRTEVWKDNVSVTIMCPGPVQTNILANSQNVDGFSAALSKREWPTIVNSMKPERAAKLISLSTVNRMGEVWISRQPGMLVTKILMWFPCFSNWFIATFYYPLMARYVHRTDGNSGAAGNKKVD